MERDLSPAVDAAPGFVAGQRLASLRAYWEALIMDHRLPARSEINPRGIADVLEHSFLIERIAPGAAQFRISGRTINALLAMEARGLPLSSLFLSEARAELSRTLEQVFVTQSVLTLALAPERRIGHDDPVSQMIILPLLDHKGHCTVAIGGIACEMAVKSGRRFAIAEAKLTRVFREETTSQHKTDVTPAVTPAPAEPKARPKTHLRLVHSAD